MIFVLFVATAQDTLHLTLSETVALARKQSPQSIAARHQYRSAYWNWRSFKADYMPSLSFNSDATLNRSISPVTLPDGSDSYVHRNQMTTSGLFTVNQNIALTGGSVFLLSGLERLDLFADKQFSYNSTPLLIGFQQSLFGYNRLKWDKKTEPIRYQQAKKSYLETLEVVAATAANRFFQLATAQSNYATAVFNYAAADTLFRYAKGRYNIGTITENEMLQLEINHLSEQTNKLNARNEMDDCILSLRSFLGISKNIEIEVVLHDSIPFFQVLVDEALQLARTNNPDVESFVLRRLESQQAIAVAKSSNGIKADLYAQFGLTQTDRNLKVAYRDPFDKQLVSLGIRIPILDWGVGRGRIEVAKSNHDKVLIDIEQSKTDFESNVVRLVKQFNLQANKVAIAEKTSQRTLRRHEVAYRLYLLGKSTILDLNAAIAEKDSSRRSYILQLQIFWSLYYGLRSITGYDFEKNRAIEI